MSKFLGDGFIAIKRIETTNFPLVKFFVVVHCQSSEQTQLMEQNPKLSIITLASRKFFLLKTFLCL